jgi:uncharacterized protein (TIRG00374 family)
MTETTEEKHTINYKRILTIGLQVVIIGLLGWYLYQNREVLASLKNIRWQQIMWIVLLDTAGFLINSLINFFMLQRLDPRIGYLDCVMLQYVNNMFNRILPTIGGGAAFRAYYLKKVYRISYTQFASTVAGLYVITFSTTALVGILCLLKIYLQFQVFNWIIFLVFATIFVGMLGVILFSPRLPASNNRWLKILKNIIDSWNIIKKETRLVLIFMFLSLILLFLYAAYMLIGYQALGVETSLTPMLYLSTLGIILALVNFTPDAIGVKEGIYIFSRDLVRIPQDILVLGSLYLRGISIVSTFLVSGVCYWVLMRRLKKAESLPVPAAEAEPR